MDKNEVNTCVRLNKSDRFEMFSDIEDLEEMLEALQLDTNNNGTNTQ